MLLVVVMNRYFTRRARSEITNSGGGRCQSDHFSREHLNRSKDSTISQIEQAPHNQDEGLLSVVLARKKSRSFVANQTAHWTVSFRVVVSVTEFRVALTVKV